MLTDEQNDLVTRTGPRTPCGDLMRRYWTPAALSEEVSADTPTPIRLLGEDLVLFRDEKGAPQLIGRGCPHRNVDLSYGRVENNGVRCIYHGWLMTGDGRVADQPGEPAELAAKNRIRNVAYPCHEAAGIILTYMGPGEPPRVPNFKFFDPKLRDQVWVSKIHHDCNYLQAHEGNVDPQHLSYLHKVFAKEKMLNALNNDLYGRDVSPQLDVEETPYGLRILAIRNVGDDKKYVRITNHIMPTCSAFAGIPYENPKNAPYDGNLGYQVHWHVPIDDFQHWKYTLIFKTNGPIDKDWLDGEMFKELDRTTYRVPRNGANRYLQDREELKTQTFAGVGRNFYDHDKMAVESQGPIMDRSNEHLGVNDRPVVALRRQLARAIEDVRAGKDPLFVERGNGPDPLAEMTVRALVLPASTDLRQAGWRTGTVGQKQ